MKPEVGKIYKAIIPFIAYEYIEPIKSPPGVPKGDLTYIMAKIKIPDIYQIKSETVLLLLDFSTRYEPFEYDLVMFYNNKKVRFKATNLENYLKEIET